MRMRRGKVIHHVVVVIVVVDPKIVKSGDVHTWASCKHNKHIEFGKKLASACSESNGTAYKNQKSRILVAIKATPIDSAHYALCMKTQKQGFIWGGGALAPPCRSLAPPPLGNEVSLFKTIDKIEYSTETQHKEYIN